MCSTAKEDSTVTNPFSLGSAVPWESVYPWEASSASREARKRASASSSGMMLALAMAVSRVASSSSRSDTISPSSTGCMEGCREVRVGVRGGELQARARGGGDLEVCRFSKLSRVCCRWRLRSPSGGGIPDYLTEMRGLRRSFIAPQWVQKLALLGANTARCGCKRVRSLVQKHAF
jgi:hypothetical protein